jgi:cellulose synthase/poly-beta-1,6-N-acetylglucosamine synthase-like glycosyltransferase
VQLSFILLLVSLIFSIPVVVISYYLLIQFLSSLRYPRKLGLEYSPMDSHPIVSILIATYNERSVIERSLDAVERVDYPHGRLQVILADDSDDETRDIIDRKLDGLRRHGIDTIVSRRENRRGYKSGALNVASRFLRGDYVLLLDADSTVPKDVLSRGLGALKNDPSLSFVSYRVGHYNRDQNLSTRLFALSQDTGDAFSKMGAYSLNLPFSLQGGFTLISARALEEVGYWGNDTIVEDADLSVKLYTAGKKGIYLSDLKIMSEDPPTLGVWKKQAARVSQGWAFCARYRFFEILTTPKLSKAKRAALLIGLLAPFASLSWIVVNFLSAFSIAFGINVSGDSIFSNPAYVGIVAMPGFALIGSALYVLYVQRILTLRNIAIIPLLSYSSLAMITANSIGFLNGILGKSGFFFRTPKKGLNNSERQYSFAPKLDKTSIAEGVTAVTALILCISVLREGVWFLGFSLLMFGALTLKSMHLSQLFSQRLQPDQSRLQVESRETSELAVPRQNVFNESPNQST